jgi:hypothetical protein
VADRDAPVPAPAQLKVTVTTKGKAERAKVIEFLRTARRRMIELEKRRVALAERKAAALLALKKHRLEKAMKRVGRVGLQAAINDAGIAEDFADDFYDTALSATRIAEVAGSIAEDDLAMDDEAGSMGDDMYDEIGMEMDDGVMAVEDDMMDEMMGEDIDDPFAEDIDDIDYEESALVDEITDVNFALQRLGMNDVDFDESGIASGGDNGSGSRSKSRIVSRRDGGAAIVSSESLQLRAGASGSLPMADESRMIPQRLDDVVYEEEMEEENDSNTPTAMPTPHAVLHVLPSTPRLSSDCPRISGGNEGRTSVPGGVAGMLSVGDAGSGGRSVTVNSPRPP